MYFCDLTLESPAENLACDEVFLDRAEEAQAGELLRVWTSPNYFVVLGYANRAAGEVNLGFCDEHKIPVLRRCTGGGTVLQGPGSLNYSLVLRIDPNGPCRSIQATNEFVMSRHRKALADLLRAPVEIQGHTDLAIGGLKFSGNAQRRQRRHLIFHGSFLLHLEVELMEQALLLPSQQPRYRLGRSHLDFLMNLKVQPVLVINALQQIWRATKSLPSLPLEEISRLASTKYSRDEWNRKF